MEQSKKRDAAASPVCGTERRPRRLSSRSRAAARSFSKVAIRLQDYGVKIGGPSPSDFCGNAASASEKRRLRRLKLGTPTARRP